MPAIGELRYFLRFEYRPPLADDGYGNREGGWRTMFTIQAKIRPLLGSETVIAARLAGIQPVRISIRSTEKTRDITVGWRAVLVSDDRIIYNITSPPANTDEKNRWLDIMAQTGVPT